mgnify:CR=1 FL=1
MDGQGRHFNHIGSRLSTETLEKCHLLVALRDDFNHIGSRLSTETSAIGVIQKLRPGRFQPHRLTVEH